MKRILYFLLISLWFVSCDSDDNTFPESSDARSTLFINECKAILSNAEYGWKMEYHPDTSLYGGYNFLLKFTEGSVTTRADITPEMTVSRWSMNMSQGPVLTFETYGLLHLLADPQYASKGYGLKGDFEFIISSYNNSEIKMVGRKGSTQVILTKAGADDINQLASMQDMLTKLILGKYEVTTAAVNNVAISSPVISFNTTMHTCRLMYKNSAGTIIDATTPFTLTSTGCSFSKPLDVEGVKVPGLNVVISEDGVKQFISTDSQSAVVFTIIYDAPLGLTPAQIPAYTPKETIKSVELMRTRYKAYKVTMMSPSMQAIADAIKKDLPNFVGFWVYIDRDKNNPGIMSFSAIDAGVEKFYYYGFDEFTMLNGSQNKVYFNKSGLTGAGNKYTSGWDGRTAYTNHAKMTEMRTTFFFNTAGHTVIYDYYDTYWIRSNANPNNWWKIEAVK